MYGATKAALNRLTIAAAGENEGVIAVNAMTPQCAILTPGVLDSGLVTDTTLFEPVETMAEAALALCTGDPAVLSGRIAFSLQLLLELDRPVYDLSGEHLLDGWQPADLVAVIRAQEEFHATNAWPDAFDFHRPHTPYPDALRGSTQLRCSRRRRGTTVAGQSQTSPSFGPGQRRAHVEPAGVEELDELAVGIPHHDGRAGIGLVQHGASVPLDAIERRGEAAHRHRDVRESGFGHAAFPDRAHPIPVVTE